LSTFSSGRSCYRTACAWPLPLETWPVGQKKTGRRPEIN